MQFCDTMHTISEVAYTMWQFIVSGYIPGTDIQITFEMIATFFVATTSFFLLWAIMRQIELIRRKTLQSPEELTQIEDWSQIAL
jgi:hypothetical protein